MRWPEPANLIPRHTFIINNILTACNTPGQNTNLIHASQLAAGYLAIFAD